MSDMRGESVATDARGSESHQPVSVSKSSEPGRSSSSDLLPPPSSSSPLPPPPAQLVAALAEFETSGPGPDSFRRSVPDFTPPDAPIGAPDPRLTSTPARADAPRENAQPAARPAAAPAASSKIAGIVAGVALVVVALWALFLR
jgi:hypothetical protein